MAGRQNVRDGVPARRHHRRTPRARPAPGRCGVSCAPTPPSVRRSALAERPPPAATAHPGAARVRTCSPPLPRSLIADPLHWRVRQQSTSLDQPNRPESPEFGRSEFAELTPYTRTSSPLGMFACPRRCTVRSPPVKCMCATERSPFSVLRTPSSRPRTLSTRCWFASTDACTSALPDQLRFPRRSPPTPRLPRRCGSLCARFARIARAGSSRGGAYKAGRRRCPGLRSRWMRGAGGAQLASYVAPVVADAQFTRQRDARERASDQRLAQPANRVGSQYSQSDSHSSRYTGNFLCHVAATDRCFNSCR